MRSIYLCLHLQLQLQWNSLNEIQFALIYVKKIFFLRNVTASWNWKSEKYYVMLIHELIHFAVHLAKTTTAKITNNSDNNDKKEKEWDLSQINSLETIVFLV